MKGINKFAAVLSKIMEVGHWVAAALMALTFVIAAFMPNQLNKIVDMEGLSADAVMQSDFSSYGYSVECFNANGSFNTKAFALFAIGSAIIMTLMAMIFRNVNLSLKTAAGKTKFSKGETPFQKDVVRMVREIGIFFISIPVIGIIVSTIGTLIIGVDVLEASMDFDGIVIGIIILCLSQIFTYGEKLQSDVDGLL